MGWLRRAGRAAAGRMAVPTIPRPLPPASTGTPSFSNTMDQQMNCRITSGPDVEQQADDSRWAVYDVSGSVVTTGGSFFITGARVSLFRGNDMIANWAESFARLKFVEVPQGDSIRVTVQGTASIRTQYPLQSVTATTGTAPLNNNPELVAQGGVSISMYGGINSSCGTSNGVIPTAQYTERNTVGALTVGDCPMLADSLVFTRSGGRHFLGYSSANGVSENIAVANLSARVYDPSTITGLSATERQGLKLCVSNFLPPQFKVFWMICGIFNAPGGAPSSVELFSNFLRGVIVGPIFQSAGSNGFLPNVEFTAVLPPIMNSANLRIGVLSNGGDAGAGGLSGKVALFGLTTPLLTGSAQSRGVGFNFI